MRRGADGVTSRTGTRDTWATRGRADRRPRARAAPSVIPSCLAARRRPGRGHVSYRGEGRRRAPVALRSVTVARPAVQPAPGPEASSRLPPGGRPETMQDARQGHQTRSSRAVLGDRACRSRFAAVSLRFGARWLGRGKRCRRLRRLSGAAHPPARVRLALIAGVDAEAPAAQLIRRVLRAAQDLDPLGPSGPAGSGRQRCSDWLDAWTRS